MASKYARRHYEDVAAILSGQKEIAIAEHGETGWPKLDLLTEVYQEFHVLFKKDNPAFDADRFKKACGF